MTLLRFAELLQQYQQQQELYPQQVLHPYGIQGLTKGEAPQRFLHHSIQRQAVERLTSLDQHPVNSFASVTTIINLFIKFLEQKIF